jgi:hypothetical protein
MILMAKSKKIDFKNQLLRRLKVGSGTGAYSFAGSSPEMEFLNGIF